MWLQRFTHYLLTNRWRALALTVAITFLPMFGLIGFAVAGISIIIATMITLVKGAYEGAIFTAAATLPYAVCFYLYGINNSSAPVILVMGSLVIVFAINILTWSFAVMLRRQSSFSSVLQIAALTGILFVSVVHLAYPDVAGWWAEQLTQAQAYVQKLADTDLGLLGNSAQLGGTSPGTAAVTASAVTPATPSTGTIKVDTVAQSETGSLVALVLLLAMIQLIVARWWQCAVFSRGTLKYQLRGVRLSHLAGISLIVSMGISYYGNAVVLDMMPILVLLFISAGLSLVHYLIGLTSKPKSWIWITLFYILLIFYLQQVGFMLLIMLALMDIWLDVRKRVVQSI